MTKNTHSSLPTYDKKMTILSAIAICLSVGVIFSVNSLKVNQPAKNLETFVQEAAPDIAIGIPEKGTHIIIIASGKPVRNVYPKFDLKINNKTVTSFSVTKNLEKYIYIHPDPITNASQIKIQFTNDYYGGGEDRNLRVDKIIIDGRVFESEDKSVYSTGTWRRSDSCRPGKKQSEWLQCGGYFQYKGEVPQPTPPPIPSPEPTFKPIETPIATNSGTPCTDTDGGRDYYKKGTITKDGRTMTDSCLLSFYDYGAWDYKKVSSCEAGTVNNPGNSKEIRCLVDDYSCKDPFNSAPHQHCPNGCANGACLTQPKPNAACMYLREKHCQPSLTINKTCQYIQILCPDAPIYNDASTQTQIREIPHIAIPEKPPVDWQPED